MEKLYYTAKEVAEIQRQYRTYSIFSMEQDMMYLLHLLMQRIMVWLKKEKGYFI